MESKSRLKCEPADTPRPHYSLRSVMKERIVPTGREFEARHVITTLHRKQIVDGILAGLTTKQIARTLGTTAGNVSSVVHLMNEGGSVRGGLIIDVVTSQKDPVAFLRERRDPDGGYLMFSETARDFTYKHDRRRGFLSKAQLNAWYEYRDIRTYPDESAREEKDMALKWKVINARSKRLFPELIRPYETGLIEAYAFSDGLEEAASRNGFTVATARHRTAMLGKKAWRYGGKYDACSVVDGDGEFGTYCPSTRTCRAYSLPV